MTVLSVFLGTLAALSFIPAAVLLVQAVAALAPNRTAPPSVGRRPRVGILIPAHNEEAVIAATLGTLAPQIEPGDRLLVVADNCTDGTAAIAREFGAQVVERTDSERCGKGYALDFGVREMDRDPPEVVIVIDADCEASPGAINRLAHACFETMRPVQAQYLMHTFKGKDLDMRVSEFAWLVKNLVRPLGNLRLGLPCQLTGTGMAIPWDAFGCVTLASGHIVEDMKLGIDLALAGYPTMYCPDVVVTSYFPGNKTAVESQRTRWEHGHLSLITQEAPRLFCRALRQGDIKLLALTVDLLVPPLSMLSLILVAILLLATAHFMVTGAVWPLALSLASFSVHVSTLALMWYAWGRQLIPPRALLMGPLYILSKAPLYLRFLTRRQKHWVKTERD